MAQVSVHTAQPVLACLGQPICRLEPQAPGGRKRFFALGSGPGAQPRRARRRSSPSSAIATRDEDACWCSRSTVRRPSALLRRIAEDCGVAPERLTFIMTPTQSLAGTVQIAARSLEVALHKAHTLNSRCRTSSTAAARRRCRRRAPDFIAAMGRTNDAILYGGHGAALRRRPPRPRPKRWPTQLPSGASRDYGRPFAETFAAYKGDFYQIDPLLFSPGLVAGDRARERPLLPPRPPRSRAPRPLLRRDAARRMNRVALFVDQPDWHARRLGAAIAARGGEAVLCSLRDCAFRLGEGGAGIDDPRLRRRAAGCGARAQHRRRQLRAGDVASRAAARAARASGVAVINDARAIERCVDKSMTSFLLHRAGIPRRRRWSARATAAAQRWRAARPRGAGGKAALRLAGTGPRAPRARGSAAGARELWRRALPPALRRPRQRLARLPRHGDRRRARRRHDPPRALLDHQRRGAAGAASRSQLSERLGALSVAAVSAVGADYAGVDLIEDEDGALMILEVNSHAGLEGPAERCRRRHRRPACRPCPRARRLTPTRAARRCAKPISRPATASSRR